MNESGIGSPNGRSLSCNAHAKINLYLRILGRRDDGFHEIRSIFQTLDLHDTLHFSPCERGISLRITGPSSMPSLIRENIIEKTFCEIGRELGREAGVRVELKKIIPVGGGLGGGSSDSSATIKALGELWDLGLTADDHLRIAARIGSDVPFFYHGGTALVEGRGEMLTPLPDIPPLSVIIVKPDFSISTAEAYSWWDDLPGGPGGPNLETGLLYSGSISHMLHNDFEEVLFPRFPVLAEIKKMLLCSGCPGALLSGSGSCIFGIVGDDSKAEIIADNVKRNFNATVFVTRTKGRVRID